MRGKTLGLSCVSLSPQILANAYVLDVTHTREFSDRNLKEEVVSL